MSDKYLIAGFTFITNSIHTLNYDMENQNSVYWGFSGDQSSQWFESSIVKYGEYSLGFSTIEGESIPDVLNEKFEDGADSGYDESWGYVVGSLDPNYSVDSLSISPPSGWGNECLKTSVVSGYIGYTYAIVRKYYPGSHTYPTWNPAYFSCEVMLDNHGFVSSGDNHEIARGIGYANNLRWALYYKQIGSDLKFELRAWPGPQIYQSDPVSLNTVYKLDTYTFNFSGAQYSYRWRVDNTLQDSFQISDLSVDSASINNLLIGFTTTTGIIASGAFDKIAISTEDWPYSISANSGHFYNQDASQLLFAGSEYVLNAWIFSSSGGAEYSAELITSLGGSEVNSFILSGTPEEWKQIKETFTLSEDITNPSLKFYYAGSGTSLGYFDNVYIEYAPYLDSGIVEIYPVEGYKIIKLQNRSDHRTQGGSHYSFKWGDYKRFEIPLEYVPNSKAQQINEWWEEDSIIQYSVFSGGIWETNTCYMINKEIPFPKRQEPYTDKFEGIIKMEVF